MKDPSNFLTPKESLKEQVHRRRHEILWNLKRMAKSRNIEEFEAYLTDDCGIDRKSREYKTAMDAFWRPVAAYELQRYEPYRAPCPSSLAYLPLPLLEEKGYGFLWFERPLRESCLLSSGSYCAWRIPSSLHKQL
jgi:hypothetical protein